MSHLFSLTYFAKKGRLQQVDNALKAVSNGETALGIKAKNGVVICAEKKLPSSLIDETSYSKVQPLSPEIGSTYAGLSPDFFVTMKKARKEALTYFQKYEEPISAYFLCKETAKVMQEFTQMGGVRPFGVSLLLAAFDEQGPQLYQVDPSGAYFGWKATAIGKNMVSAKNFLEKRYAPDIDIDDAVHHAILTIKENFEGELTEKNIDVGIAREIEVDGKKKREFRVLTQAEVKNYLDEAS